MVRFTASLLIAAVLCLAAFPAQARNSVLTDIKVIHASTGATHVDPGLSSIIEELGPLFKYTDYRLLKEKRVNLNFGQKGTVTLPDNRVLEATPQAMQGKRIPYQIRILKNSRTIFNTQVLLNNGKSVTIGGPKYNNGMLLINIAGKTD